MTSAIELILVDPLTGLTICDADVVVTDGDYQERAEMVSTQPEDPVTHQGPQCVYVAGDQRPGTYRVDVSHPDFVPITKTVHAPELGCSVEEQHLKLTLQHREEKADASKRAGPP
jgi:hypothetical protein